MRGSNERHLRLTCGLFIFLRIAGVRFVSGVLSIALNKSLRRLSHKLRFYDCVSARQRRSISKRAL